MIQYPYIKRITLLIHLLCTAYNFKASPARPTIDSTQISTQQQAIAFLDSLQKLDSSKHWPNVDPVLFLQNLRTFAITPLKFYEGKGTNFCAYSALTYI